MILSNNRFLRRVNPQITRALADSGSSLNHSEIQQLMRQMVDLGIADNLKLWVHSGLVKTRTAGAETFIAKAYGISSNNFDAAQTTEANQPKLVSDGMEFDGSGDFLLIPHDAALNYITPFTLCTWCKFKTLPTGTTTNNTLLGKGTATSGSGGYDFKVDFISGVYSLNLVKYFVADQRVNIASLSVNTWCHFVAAAQSDRVKYYVNGSHVGDSLNATPAQTNIKDFEIARFRDGSKTTHGAQNDIRIYNSTLAASQIAAIYNATKAKYGH